MIDIIKKLLTKTRVVTLTLLFVLPCLVNGQNKSYQFDGNGISREVLENYLEKAITMVYLLITKSPACPVGYSQEETIKALWAP